MQAFNMLVSASDAERLAEARRFIASQQAGVRVLIVGASRGAADDLAREVSATVPATFGIQRLTLTQLAARTAMVALADDGVTPSTWLGAEAVATRAVFDTIGAEALRYFAPVADTVLLLDVPLEHAAERDLVDALLAGASSVLATVPTGDTSAREAFGQLGAVVVHRDAAPADDLGCPRRFLFTTAEPPE